ncbi:hypothetical protein BESB_047740 [Besnoitia besnoiti]|uniref:Transmembrane protein n=1 Tax=Besnoitia besnoiti TaxID=94643 RepID=A0A2A9MM50_BESBE|nr:hypothetical protein BESB_047740 [Besnoitia besnoiti]PFH36582.1 hypothetical protein BESB_047740 [Besnoitia besnoiti]
MWAAGLLLFIGVACRLTLGAQVPSEEADPLLADGPRDTPAEGLDGWRAASPLRELELDGADPLTAQALPVAAYSSFGAGEQQRVSGEETEAEATRRSGPWSSRTWRGMSRRRRRRAEAGGAGETGSATEAERDSGAWTNALSAGGAESQAERVFTSDRESEARPPLFTEVIPQPLRHLPSSPSPWQRTPSAGADAAERAPAEPAVGGKPDSESWRKNKASMGRWRKSLTRARSLVLLAQMCAHLALAFASVSLVVFSISRAVAVNSELAELETNYLGDILLSMPGQDNASRLLFWLSYLQNSPGSGIIKIERATSTLLTFLQSYMLPLLSAQHYRLQRKVCVIVASCSAFMFATSAILIRPLVPKKLQHRYKHICMSLGLLWSLLPLLLVAADHARGHFRHKNAAQLKRLAKLAEKHIMMRGITLLGSLRERTNFKHIVGFVVADASLTVSFLSAVSRIAYSRDNADGGGEVGGHEKSAEKTA